MHNLCLSCQSSLDAKKHLAFCTLCGSGRIFRTNENLEQLKVAHIDCDSFYAQIEKRDHHQWIAEPIAVGKMVVLSACYIARMYGVRAGMPMFEARALCPILRIVQPTFSKYRSENLILRQVVYALKNHHPKLRIEFASIDECWLDFGTQNNESIRNSPRLTEQQKMSLTARKQVWQEVSAIQNKFKQEREISISVGIGENKLLSKIAVRCCKPQGFAVLSTAKAKNFLAQQSPQILPGVGRVTAQRLRQQGITRISQLQAQPLWALTQRWGRFAEQLHNMSFGKDKSSIFEKYKRKSNSIERTFSPCIYNRNTMQNELKGLCHKLAQQLQKRNEAGRTIVLKLRRKDLSIVSRTRSISYPISDSRQIFNIAAYNLDNEISQSENERRGADNSIRKSQLGYRLIGVAIKSLQDKQHSTKKHILVQQSLF